LFETTTLSWRSRCVLLFTGCMLSMRFATASPPSPSPSPSPSLQYSVQEGPILNRFFRQGSVAAHLLLRGGTQPRLLIAFPAGNSGVGVWFEPTAGEARWSIDSAIRPVQVRDSRGRALNGIAVDAVVTAPSLRVREAVLSSVRELRDYQALGKANPLVNTAVEVHGNTLSWSRDRLDGAPGYRLKLAVIRGHLQDGQIMADASGTIGLRITGATGDPPLTPLEKGDLFSSAAAPDPSARQTLSFLAFREKLLAGSWRFDTYFGRDTLMSVRLLMPALNPIAIESGLASVLSRLSPQGEVAHEEDIAERAILDHLQSDSTRSAAPVFDYKMIDGNYLLAPVVASYLLQDPRAQHRSASFLQAQVESGGSRSGARGAALLDNLRFVLQAASAFADQPDARHLIALKSGVEVGQWRDSDTGLGHGRVPYDVNAVLVPAALDAISALQRSGLLLPYQTDTDAALFARAESMAAVWHDKAAPLFDVVVPHDAAANAVTAYAQTQGLPSQEAVSALGDGAVQFSALALDDQGQPLPILHSDVGFELLFARPAAQRLGHDLATVMRPFPAGLMTDVGMLVANPVFADSRLQDLFTRNAYHGTVIWSWQQALMAAGLARQLARDDLPAAVRSELVQAQAALWRAIAGTKAVNSSELWSWSWSDGRYAVVPFGSAAADADESNAAQLWSTVYLAVQPPGSRP
jgi:hypothetical protein